MRQKKSELQIGIDSSGLSSDFNRAPLALLPPVHKKRLEIRTQRSSTPHNSNYTPTQFQSHLQIQISSISPLQLPSSNPSTPTCQNPKPTLFKDEPVCYRPSANKTLVSTPQKRSMMSQSPSALSHSPTLSSLQHFRRTTVLNSESSQTSFAVVLATKTIALRLFRHFHCVRWLQVHLRFFILLSLPSIYFFTSNLSHAFLVDFVFFLAFSATLVISVNLALPRLPSIRLFLARSFAIKPSSTATASKPYSTVVWSIGFKPKSHKQANSGTWVQVYSNGDVYEGEFHKGKRSGSGVYYCHMSGRYEGDWVDDKYDGYGVETWAKGSRYRGQYRQGLRHGLGIYRFYTGDAYAGEWCNGQCHGCGVHTCEDESRYFGEFKWGIKHGLGHYHFRNGDTYAGEYFADRMHGFGVYQFGNGHRYEGAWHEGKMQGLGVYTFRDGETQLGHWQNGVLNVSTTQGSLPGSPFTASHSKVLNAVQEARQAAQRAYNLAKVDERVNRAIVAANKSANAARVAAIKALQNQMHDNSNNDGASNLII